MKENYKDIASRKWQQDGLENLETFYRDDERDVFFVHACPAAGKTRFSLAAIKMAHETKSVDLTVVVVPSETLKNQWKDDARGYGIRLEHFTSAALQDTVLDGLGEVTGIVTTYAGLLANVAVYDHWCKDRKVLLVADEIHHCAETLSWGDGLKAAFYDAHKRIILSGTPFRSRETEVMPFIMENDGAGSQVVIKPDASLTYREAVDQEICRVITFPRVNANITFEDDEGHWSSDLDSPELKDNEAKRKRLYRAALDPERCGFSAFQLEQAYDKLQEIRENEQSDAAMLVVAKDINHATQLQLILQGITGKKPPLVTSEEKSSQQVIERFKNSKAPVIVSVMMFAEGVDAPRIRVISYMSTVKTEMFFRQVVGRAVRMQNEAHITGKQWSYMFIPKMPDFERMARDIEQEIEYIVSESKATRGDSTYQQGGNIATKHFTIYGDSNLRRDGYISMGIDVTEQERVRALELSQHDPVLARLGAEYVALCLRVGKEHPDLNTVFR